MTTGQRSVFCPHLAWGVQRPRSSEKAQAVRGGGTRSREGGVVGWGKEQGVS